MAKLADFGFVDNVVYETIVSTYNPDGTPNAAPMATIIHNPHTTTLNIYNTSNTNRNLKATKTATINLTNNIDLFYKATIKEANPNGKLPISWFQKATMINAPKLRMANATIEVAVDEIVPVADEKTKFICSVKNVETTKGYPQAYSRAFGLTLEALIHATRVKVFSKDPDKQKHVNKLLVLIENSDALVKRVAPNSAYSKVMADLMKRVDSWRFGL